MIKSPLTGKENTIAIEEVRVADIQKLYKKLSFRKLDEFNGIEKITLYKCLDTDLLFFYPQVTGSEAFYEHLQKFDWYYLDNKSEYRFAEKFVQPNSRVLDVGCGRGQFGTMVAHKANFIGLEFNDEAIKKAKAKGLHIVKESIQQHAEANASQYDLVTAFQVLEHISDIKGFIEACRKTLKPGGQLIFSVPSYDSLVSLQLNNTLNLPPHHVSWWTDDCLKNLGVLFNMEVKQIHHEALDKEHKRWFGFLIIAEALKNVFHFKTSKNVIDRSLKLKMINGISGVISPFIAGGIRDSRLSPHGQSVTAVYRKES